MGGVLGLDYASVAVAANARGIRLRQVFAGLAEMEAEALRRLNDK